MIISNINTKYIKLDSTSILDIINNPNDYTAIDITVSLNCCKEDGIDKVYTDTLDLTLPLGWSVDLTTPVEELQSLININIFNSISQLTNNALLTSIDLAPVIEDCLTEDCTIENSATDYSLTFKTVIDAWFASIGITSNVSVTFTGNIAFISNLPTNFFIMDAAYGTIESPVILEVIYISEGSSSFLAGNSLFLRADLFDESDLKDGVYKVDLKLSKEDSHITESNCAFIDITVACQVANKLKDLLDSSSKKNKEPVATMIHLLHYAITNGSNCGCNCDDLCKGYKELACLLDNTKITTDCGC